jgi:hypothetical protein
MPVGWVAGAMALGSVASGVMGADAAKDAARTQGDSARYATDVQREMFDISREGQQPFMQSGYGANAELSRLMGIAPQTATGSAPGPQRRGDLVANRGGVPAMNQELYASDPGYREAWDKTLAWEKENRPGWKGQETYWARATNEDWNRLNEMMSRNLAEYDAANTPAPGEAGSTLPASGGTGLPTGYLTQTFGPDQFKAGMDPGYQWRAQQGAQGVMNTAAAGSGSLSGPALKALMEYNQGAASQEYGAGFDRFQTQQGNIFQRLTSMAGMGQNAAAGVGNNAMTTGSNIGGNIIGAGNAAAAGQIGAANAWGGALSDLGSIGAWYGMGRQPAGP